MIDKTSAMFHGEDQVLWGHVKNGSSELLSSQVLECIVDMVSKAALSEVLRPYSTKVGQKKK